MSSAELPIPRIVPVLLSFVAGYVDAVTFLALFGLFVAQVTGSFVVAGAQLVAHSDMWLVTVLAIPAFFCAGAVATLLVECAERRGVPALPWALGLETMLLVGFLSAAAAGFPFPNADAALAMTATLLGLSAMGVQSATVRLLMRGVASTNVMTTNTTQLSIDVTQTATAWFARRRVADAVSQARYAAARARLAGLWPIVSGFLVGTGIGAIAFVTIGLWCLPAAIVIVAGLTGWAARRG